MTLTSILPGQRLAGIASSASSCGSRSSAHIEFMYEGSFSAGPDQRLDRQFDRIARQVPASAAFLRWVRRPGMHLVRIPLALLLLLGGLFSFLPVLGLWMLPLGLLVLAIDVPGLRRPVGNAVVRLRRWLSLRRRQFRRR